MAEGDSRSPSVERERHDLAQHYSLLSVERQNCPQARLANTACAGITTGILGKNRAYTERLPRALQS